MHKRVNTGLSLLTGIVVASSAALLARADTVESIRERGVLLWGADAEGGGPFVYPRDDAPTACQGFEFDLANLLAARLGVRAELVQGQWDKLPDLAKRGDIDIVLNGYEWTPTWAERYGTTIPYYIYHLQMLVRKDDPRFRTLDDLRAPREDKPRVAVLGGSAADRYVRREFGDAIEVVRYDGSTDAMRAVEIDIDGIDATVQDLPVVTFYERRFPGLRRLGEPVEPGYYVILTRPGDESLVRALNQAVLDVYADGSFPQVLDRYGLWNDAQRQRGLITGPDGDFRPDPAAPAGAGEVAEHNDWWDDVRSRTPLLLRAALITVLLAVCSMPLAIAAGILIAVGRLYGPRGLRPVLGWYVEIIRGTPLVLQLYVIFFLLPELGLYLPKLVAGVLGLALNYSAYEAEIYRAGLQAIPRGQLEAALSLGMSRLLALRRIIIPQAFRLVIPPVMNDFIALFKDTAVCSVITIFELSKEYYIHAQSTGRVVELGLVTALLYLAMSYPLSILVARLERRLAEGRPHA
ncbi:MAG: ABC transporter substrate-binding protein/permease [Pirellulaceae bacterium]|jgi:polar amino acid transport system substrate-binding protein|nr:ABC transporter substrate-binding protein/permease [Pirellulaceae bacterium]